MPPSNAVLSILIFMSTFFTSINLLCGLPLSSCLVGPSSTLLEQYICYSSSALAQTISGSLPSYKPSLSIWLWSFSHKSVGVGGDNTHLHQLQPACILYFISLAHYPFYWMADPGYFNYSTFTTSPQFIFTFLFQKNQKTKLSLLSHTSPLLCCPHAFPAPPSHTVLLCHSRLLKAVSHFLSWNPIMCFL